MQLIIDIPDEYYFLILRDVEDFGNDYKPLVLIAKGIPLPKGHGDLIDRDRCLNYAWSNFWKQEDEDRKIEGYEILRDEFWQQRGFGCFLETIVNEPAIIETDRVEDND